MGAPTRLSDFDFRSNSIGFLRLLFALVVVWSHAYDLGGFGFDPIVWYSRGADSAGLLAVAGFFVLSGFLVTRSYESTNNLGRYLWHRFLRIFPGYYVCLLVVAFLIAPLAFLCQHGNLQHFLTIQPTPISYVLKNLTSVMRQQSIGSIISKSPEPEYINGPLWTIPVELTCYFAVAVLGFGSAVNLRRRIPIATAILYVAFCASTLFMRREYFFHFDWSIEIACSFLLGSLGYLYRDRISVNPVIFALAATLLLFVLPIGGIAEVLRPLLLGYMVLYAGMNIGPRSLDRKFDLSYGVYIYAYPIQQLLMIYGLSALGFAAYLVITIGITASLAVASWFLIERPSLSLKNARLDRRSMATRNHHESDNVTAVADPASPVTAE